LPLISFSDDRYDSDNFLPLGICPGPSQPKDLDSFLGPFLEELKLLEDGVPAYDAYTESEFLLKAHLVLVTGDTTGISKLLHLSGHVAKHPCRACTSAGTPYKIPFKDKNGRQGEKTQYYYPLQPFMDSTNGSRSPRRTASSWQFDIRNLPRRTEAQYLADGQASLDNPKCAVDSGVKGKSPLVDLPTFSFPESAPFDSMHLVFLNFVRHLCELVSGKYFKDAILNNHSGRMTEKDWVKLGIDMSNIEAPVSWGRYPRNIEKYIKGFKAEELSNFLIHYLLPLSFNRVSRSTFRAFQRLVFAISMAISYEINMEEIDEVETHLILFIKWFYDTFYQGKYERLPACKYTIHAMVHIFQDIRNWGPVCYYWQFPEV